jgi:hypothetical protein
VHGDVEQWRIVVLARHHGHWAPETESATGWNRRWIWRLSGGEFNSTWAS